MRGRVLVALLGLAVVPARAEERADADLRRLFPEQADVFVAPPGGLSRLKVPAGYSPPAGRTSPTCASSIGAGARSRT